MGAGSDRVRPAWALTWRWKSSENLVTGTQGNRKGVTARERPKEAGNEGVVPQKSTPGRVELAPENRVKPEGTTQRGNSDDAARITSTGGPLRHTVNLLRPQAAAGGWMRGIKTSGRPARALVRPLRIASAVPYLDGSSASLHERRIFQGPSRRASLVGVSQLSSMVAGRQALARAGRGGCLESRSVALRGRASQGYRDIQTCLLCVMRSDEAGGMG